MDKLEDRLAALGLQGLLVSTDENDLPYPLPRKRVLRVLEVASTQFPEKAIDIMVLHRDILEGKVDVQSRNDQPSSS